MSKTIGSGVVRPKTSAGGGKYHHANIDKKIDEHRVNNNVRDSGYLTNFSTGDKKGWVPEKILHSNKMKQI